MSDNQILDLETLANQTLDNIADAPDFVNPPAGEYTLLVKDVAIDKYKTKDGTASQRMKITYSIGETLSTLNNEPPVPNESIFTETFQATEQGMGFFKKRIKELMGVSDVAGVTLGDMMSSIKGQTLKARLSYKKSESNGKTYENLQLRVVR